MECHPRALPTPSQSNGIRFRPNTPVSKLIRHVIRATEANDTAPIPPNCEELRTGRTLRNRPALDQITTTREGSGKAEPAVKTECTVTQRSPKILSKGYERIQT